MINIQMIIRSNKMQITKNKGSLSQLSVRKKERIIHNSYFLRSSFLIQIGILLAALLDLNNIFLPNFNFSASGWGQLSTQRAHSIHIEVVIFPPF